MSKARGPGTSEGERPTLDRDAWLAAAREVLERSGIASVKIDALARGLRVTRGSFYFHFEGLRDLQEGLLATWRARNRLPFERLAARADLRGVALFSAAVHVWVDEDPFSPRLDLAVRDWARTDAALAAEVAEADRQRLALIARAFREMGYGEDESVVRARITYLHQIGYDAIAFAESPADRRRLQPLYGAVLLGPLATDDGA